MTKTTTNIDGGTIPESYKKLSIRVGLNGLSFCILDTISNAIVASKNRLFNSELTPYLLQKELKRLFEDYKLIGKRFDSVMVVHQNMLFGLVPKDLFDANELPNYLKFNAKIKADDHIVFDTLENQGLVNVYVPYVNINNYVFDLFGEFEFTHSTTVFLQTLLAKKMELDTQCYVHISMGRMELLVVSQRKLQLYNQFQYNTKEDFLYYLLFVLEQLNVSPEEIKLYLFGSIESGDAIHTICHEYITQVALIKMPHPPSLEIDSVEELDFCTINSLQ